MSLLSHAVQAGLDTCHEGCLFSLEHAAASCVHSDSQQVHLFRSASGAQSTTAIFKKAQNICSSLMVQLLWNGLASMPGAFTIAEAQDQWNSMRFFHYTRIQGILESVLELSSIHVHCRQRLVHSSARWHPGKSKVQLGRAQAAGKR